MKLVIASDHGGYELKTSIVSHVVAEGCDVIDMGVETSMLSADYPVLAEMVANKVRNKEADCGILCCGTGIGMSIAANKLPGIRAAVVTDVFSAKAAKEHNNSNILCLGQRVTGEGLALLIVDEWLRCSFLAGRHQQRVSLIHQLEH